MARMLQFRSRPRDLSFHGCDHKTLNKKGLRAKCNAMIYLLMFLEKLVPLEEVPVLQLLLQQLVSLVKVLLLHVPYCSLTV